MAAVESVACLSSVCTEPLFLALLAECGEALFRAGASAVAVVRDVEIYCTLWFPSPLTMDSGGFQNLVLREVSPLTPLESQVEHLFSADFWRGATVCTLVAWGLVGIAPWPCVGPLLSLQSWAMLPGCDYLFLSPHPIRKAQLIFSLYNQLFLLVSFFL